MRDLSHLISENSIYLDQLFKQYQEAPETLPSDWKYFFDGVEFSKLTSKGTSDFDREIKVVKLIEAYRNFGHIKANLDPLAIQKTNPEFFHLNKFGLNDKDLKDVFHAGKLCLGREAQLAEIVSFLEASYCGTLTVEYDNVSPEIREWVIQEIEQKRKFELTKDEKKNIFEDLIKTEGLEKFLHTRFVGAKRFSIEGVDALIPMLNRIFSVAAKSELSDLVIGMAHRGRLNVLTNFVGRGLKYLLAEFDGKEAEGPSWYQGDVKYHLGFVNTRQATNGKSLQVSLAFNPSHLETVNPVVEGMAWAKQNLQGEKGKDKVLPILMHGDAAFIGQGVVSETLQMSMLKAYSTGGTIHIVTDNHVGFTTSCQHSRSSRYSSDVVKPLQIPIIHVNADDVESCVRAADLAFKFRLKFKKDICIRLSGYRRHGHNEGDEPSFTQPLMYEKIKTHPTLREKYQNQLEGEGVYTSGEGSKLFDQEISRCQMVLDEVRTKPPKWSLKSEKGVWTEYREVNIDETKVECDTRVPEAQLVKLGDLVLNVPTKVSPLPKLKSVIERRYSAFKDKKTVDWAGAELLAYASILAEGTSIRMTGQDVQRGTFSHRHAVYHDHKTDEIYNILNDVNASKAEFYSYDSLLSEYAVLGFEYGVSCTNPKMLTIWEAQFGDFSNGAQIIIDQYLAAGEHKWQQMSGLVLLLPHGLEGQGPEHSSARLERFLQLCAQGNMQVCNVTTPAQFFHLMRRQIKRNIRKPLVVMSPKSLFRHPKVVSTVSELSAGHFQEAIPDKTINDPKKTKRAILCTGKIYYELLDEKEKHKLNDDIAIIRVEQIYPFPFQDLITALKEYTNLGELIWAQEEPENMGALFFVRSKMNRLKQELNRKEINLGYIARPERSSPAVGSLYRHKHEQEELLQKAFNLSF